MSVLPGQIAGSTTPRPVRTSRSIWRVAAWLAGRGGSSGSVALPCRSTAAGGDTDQERAIAHTRTAARIRESSLLSANLVKTGGTITDKDGDSQSAKVDSGQRHQLPKTMARVSVPAVRPTTVCRWTKATCHQCQHPALPACSPAALRRWGRHPGLQPECRRRGR